MTWYILCLFLPADQQHRRPTCNYGYIEGPLLTPQSTVLPNGVALNNASIGAQLLARSKAGKDGKGVVFPVEDLTEDLSPDRTGSVIGGAIIPPVQQPPGPLEQTRLKRGMSEDLGTNLGGGQVPGVVPRRLSYIGHITPHGEKELATLFEKNRGDKLLHAASMDSSDAEGGHGVV